MPDRFAFVKKGYDPAQVDRHIDELERTIKEYREKDASISHAILSAQLAADEIISKAETAAAAITQNARNMSSQLIDFCGNQAESILNAVKEQKKGLRSFKEEYAALLNKYVHAMDGSDIAAAEREADKLEAHLQQFIDREILVKESE